MDKHNDELRKILLKADGLIPNEVTETERIAFQQILNREQAPLGLWRIIMHSKLTKLAAVAAVMLASIVIVCHLDGGTSVTWAGIMEPLMTAQTAVFDVVTEVQGTTTKAIAMIMGQRVRYETVGSQALPVTIIDYERLQMQYLIPEKKQAVRVDFESLGDQVPENVLESIRDVIQEMENDPNASIERLPDSEVDGLDVVGFRAASGGNQLTVWADPQTLIPIRLEEAYEGIHVICTNFQFDIALDPSLFSTDVPAGYTIASGQLDFEDHGEEGLLNGLRLWAQILEDNQFPEDLTVSTYQKMPGLKKKMREGSLKLTDQEKMDMALNIMGPFFKFIMSLKPEQDWHYVGGGVPFGDTTQPVAWYKPIGSDTYRVIYGDLSVQDVAAEDLPK